MASTSSFPPLVSPKTPVAIVLAGPIITLGPHWRNCIANCINPLVKCLGPLARMKLVAYSQVHPALVDPVYSAVEHDEEGNIVKDGVVMGDSPENAAFCGYMSVIKIIDDLRTRHPNEELSFFLWHVATGPHGSWDPKWEIVCGELMKRDVNLSMVLIDDCPVFVQLFSVMSPARAPITPWFHTFPDHKFLLSGFMPPDELGGAVPSLVSTAHPPSQSISVPSTIGVTAWNSYSELPAYGTRYPDDQRAAPPFSQYAGSDVYAQVPATAPFFNPYEGPQYSSSAAEEIDSGDDFANANARSMSSGSSDEMSDNEWTGTLNLNGTRVPVRALMTKAVGDPKLSALPNELEVEPAVGLKLSTLAIQVWIREHKSPIVRLSYVDGTDNCDFDRLVEEIRDHGYAIVTWENRDRLLLAPLGKGLLCAAFPEEGTPERPTPQQPRRVRTVTPNENRQKKESSQTKKKESPRTKKKQKYRQRPGPYSARTSKSSNGPCDELYPEAAVQSTTTLQQPQPEQPQMPYYPQVAVESTRSEINPSGQWHQMDGLAQRQMISPPLFQVELHPYLQASRGVLGAHGGPLVRQWMGTGTAGCIADPSNLKLEAMEVADSEIYEYVNFDGCAV